MIRQNSTPRQAVLRVRRERRHRPENILVLYQRGDIGAQALAAYYIGRRGIPASNVLEIPSPWRDRIVASAAQDLANNSGGAPAASVTRAEIKAMITAELLNKLRVADIAAIVCCGWWPLDVDDTTPAGGVAGARTFYNALTQPFGSAVTTSSFATFDPPGQPQRGTDFGYGPQIDVDDSVAQADGGRNLSLLDTWGIRVSSTDARGPRWSPPNYRNNIWFPNVTVGSPANAYDIITGSGSDGCNLPESYVHYPVFILAGPNITLSAANAVTAAAGTETLVPWGPETLSERERVALAIAKRVIDNSIEAEAARYTSWGEVPLVTDPGGVNLMPARSVWNEIAWGNHPFTLMGPVESQNAFYRLGLSAPTVAYNGISPANFFPYVSPAASIATYSDGSATKLRKGGICIGGRSNTWGQQRITDAGGWNASLLRDATVILHPMATLSDITTGSAGHGHGVIGALSEGASLSECMLKNNAFTSALGSGATVLGDPLYRPFGHWNP